MPTLLLLRHARAAWPKPGTQDFDRPLTETGRTSALAAGSSLDAAGLRPDAVLCSPSLRTRQTWELASSRMAAQPPADYVDALYDGDAADYLDIVRGAGEAETVLIVGHNPMTEDLAIALAGGGDSQAIASLGGGFPVCGLAVLEFDTPLDRIVPGAGRLVRFTAFEG